MCYYALLNVFNCLLNDAVEMKIKIYLIQIFIYVWELAILDNTHINHLHYMRSHIPYTIYDMPYTIFNFTVKTTKFDFHVNGFRFENTFGFQAFFFI